MLYTHAVPATEIVDRAQKELTVEKALRKIEETWGGLSLAFAPYQDTGALGHWQDGRVGVLCLACASHFSACDWQSLDLFAAAMLSAGVAAMSVEDAVVEALESDNLTLQVGSCRIDRDAPLSMWFACCAAPDEPP